MRLEIETQIRAAQDVEVERVEEPDRVRVPADRADAHLTHAPLARGCDHGLGQKPADSAPAPAVGDDDGLELGLVCVEHESGEADDVPVEIRDPDPFGDGEVRVEPAAGLVASDRRVVVEVAMPRSELGPEAPTRLQIARRVGSDRRRGRHAAGSIAAAAKRVIACVVLVLPSACGGSDERDEGVIVAARRDGIYVLRPDGTGVEKIRGLAEYGAPVVSPDGAWLALAGAGAGVAAGLYVARRDGAGVRLVRENAYDASWSPDSKRLVFTLDACAGRGDRCYETYEHVADLGSIGVDGRGFRRLTRNRFYEGQPDWSPDGRTIVFEGDAGVYAMDADGANARVLVRGGGAPQWAPDGRRLLVAGWRGTLVVDVRTGRATRLPPPPGPFAWADWSLDGKRIVFSSKRAKAWTAHDPLQLWVMNADGSDPHPITRSFGWFAPDWGASD